MHTSFIAFLFRIAISPKEEDNQLMGNESLKAGVANSLFEATCEDL